MSEEKEEKKIYAEQRSEGFDITMEESRGLREVRKKLDPVV